MRLFLGIEIPEDVKNHIYAFLLPCQTALKGWENPQDYHQTLLFIGEVSTDDLKIILERLANFQFTPFTLTLDKFYFFNRRIMYLGFLPSIALIDLKKKVEEVFHEWVKPQKKPFVPHITVKRWQRYEYDGLKSCLNSRFFEKKEILVYKLVLFKSEKDQYNQKYHVMSKKLF